MRVTLLWSRKRCFATGESQQMERKSCCLWGHFVLNSAFKKSSWWRQGNRVLSPVFPLFAQNSCFCISLHSFETRFCVLCFTNLLHKESYSLAERWAGCWVHRCMVGEWLNGWHCQSQVCARKTITSPKQQIVRIRTGWVCWHPEHNAQRLHMFLKNETSQMIPPWNSQKFPWKTGISFVIDKICRDQFYGLSRTLPIPIWHVAITREKKRIDKCWVFTKKSVYLLVFISVHKISSTDVKFHWWLNTEKCLFLPDTQLSFSVMGKSMSIPQSLSVKKKTSGLMVLSNFPALRIDHHTTTSSHVRPTPTPNLLQFPLGRN